MQPVSPENGIAYKGMWWLTPRRTRSVEEMVGKSNSFACIYARISGAPPETTLSPAAAVEQHWRWVRAIVDLNAPSNR
jgi:hypothetical protein